MGIFDWLFSKRKKGNGEPELPGEHAVLVFIKLSDDDFGAEDEREKIFALEEKLIQSIEEFRAGEYDGNEFGGGHATLYMYSHDADVLYDVVIKHFEGLDFIQDSYIIKRYGPAGDPDVKEVKVDLG